MNKNGKMIGSCIDLLDISWMESNRESEVTDSISLIPHPRVQTLVGKTPSTQSHSHADVFVEDMLGETPFHNGSDVSTSPDTSRQPMTPFDDGNNVACGQEAASIASGTSTTSKPDPGTINDTQSFSDRLRPLRPEGCNGVPPPYLSKSTDDDGQLPYRHMSGRIGPQLRRYTSDLLNYNHTPVNQSTELNKGALSSAERQFFMNFHGNWVMDNSRSDDIDAYLKMMGMNPERRESNRPDRLSLSIDEFNVTMRAYIRGLRSINEVRPWSGGRIGHERRGGIPGGAEIWIERYPQGLIFRTRWNRPNAADIYEYCEPTPDFMHLVTRQDIFMESQKILQRRVVWDRQLA